MLAKIGKILDELKVDHSDECQEKVEKKLEDLGLNDSQVQRLINAAMSDDEKDLEVCLDEMSDDFDAIENDDAKDDDAKDDDEGAGGLFDGLEDDFKNGKDFSDDSEDDEPSPKVQGSDLAAVTANNLVCIHRFVADEAQKTAIETELENFVPQLQTMAKDSSPIKAWVSGILSTVEKKHREKQEADRKKAIAEKKAQAKLAELCKRLRGVDSESSAWKTQELLICAEFSSSQLASFQVNCPPEDKANAFDLCLAKRGYRGKTAPAPGTPDTSGKTLAERAADLKVWVDGRLPGLTKS